MNLAARSLLAAVAVLVCACRAPEPQLAFLDDESSLSFVHPPRWVVGSAEQSGVRYRYLTAPKVGDDKEALSVTLISPTAASGPDAVAAAYLTGAFGVVVIPGKGGATTWTFKDQAGVSSRLHVAPASQGTFIGAWARGSEAAMKRYETAIEALMSSLQVEIVPAWPEEHFAGMAIRAAPSWNRGSRLSNDTNASMQFKSPALVVDRGTATIHAFVTLAKEPVPAPGSLDAYEKLVRDRAGETVARLDHSRWPAIAGLDRPEGYVDYLRSGTPVSSTRIKRWIAVRNGVGLTLTCEARSDAYDRADPWCRRMAATVRFE